MPSGGRRPGAGRKKGLQAEAYRKALLDLVEKNKTELARALVDKGLAGDIPALKEINERMLGKVPAILDPGDGETYAFGVVMLPPKNGPTLATTTQTGNSSRKT
jgi:hypothetical protein